MQLKHSTGGVYPIRNEKIVKRSVKYIIVSHIRNFYEIGTVLPPIVLSSNPMVCAQIMEYYFCKQMAPKRVAAGYKTVGMPYHYYIEQVDNDYMVSIGAPEYHFSYFMDDLVDAGILPTVFKYSIVIATKFDFSKEGPVERFYDQLGYKILGPLMDRYKLDFNEVKYIDEIIDKKRFENTRLSLPYKYDYTESIYFDYASFDRMLKEYNVSNLIRY